MNRQIRHGLVLSSALLLVACGGLGKLNPFADAPKNRPTALTDLASTLKITTAWQLQLGAAPSGALTLNANAEQPRLYAGAGTSAMVIDASSGKVLVRGTAPNRLSSGVGADGSLFTAATIAGDVLAWAADGTQKWRASLNAEVLATPGVSDGVVAVLTTDGRLVGFDASTGKRRWVVQRPAPALTLRSASPVVAVRNGFIVGLPGGRIVAVSARDGVVRWETGFSVGRGANEVERITDIAASVTAIGEDLCMSSYQGKIGCINLREGRPQWEKNFSSAVGVAALGNTLFATDDQSLVQAFSGNTGAALWRQDKLQHRNLSAPAAVANHVAVGDFKGFVHFLAVSDGALAARVATDGSAVRTAPAGFEVAGRKLIAVQTVDGGVFGFEVQ